MKSVTTFRDHEGAPCCQGNVYYKGKKLGFWSQDSWGGPDRYDFDERVLEDAVKSYAKSDRVEDKYKDIFNLDCLMQDILNLAQDEKDYKKCVKKGYKTYVRASDGFHVSGYYCMETPEQIAKTDYHKKFLQNIKETFFQNTKTDLKMFSSPSDFVLEI